MKRLAGVSWSALDVQELREDWSTKRCEAFLNRHAKKLKEAMIEAGWHYLEQAIDGVTAR